VVVVGGDPHRLRLLLDLGTAGVVPLLDAPFPDELAELSVDADGRIRVFVRDGKGQHWAHLARDGSLIPAEAPDQKVDPVTGAIYVEARVVDPAVFRSP
jgi:hypothetical protein